MLSSTVYKQRIIWYCLYAVNYPSFTLFLLIGGMLHHLHPTELHNHSECVWKEMIVHDCAAAPCQLYWLYCVTVWNHAARHQHCLLTSFRMCYSWSLWFQFRWYGRALLPKRIGFGASCYPQNHSDRVWRSKEEGQLGLVFLSLNELRRATSKIKLTICHWCWKDKT